MKKKLKMILLGILLLSMFFYEKPALAQGTGTIELQGNEGQTLKGKKFLLHKIFTCENSTDGQSLLYQFHPPYEQAVRTVIGERMKKEPAEVTEKMAVEYIEAYHSSSLEEFRSFVEQLKDEIVKEGIKGEEIEISTVEEDGSFLIDGLSYGYYLLNEVTLVEGKHCASSLCMLNTVSPNAKIHIKSDYPSVEKKIQEDDHKDEIGNDGWNDVGDFLIGQNVPYQFVSDVPDMTGYESYYYAWHDRMEDALSFQKNSVEIRIEGADNKSYTLSNQEYEITDSIQGETFQIRIKDLKKIVDREFKEKNYGQKVILRYDAILNEKAAKDTGRPGFENDVKLEFSNNPNSDGKGQTGETPWDSVVCFTYKINGVKENEHKVRLEGAKFQLYLDEECKTKVLEEVETGTDGTFTIAGLDRGTYWLKEVKAPSGYRILERPVKIEILPFYTEQRNSYLKGESKTDQTLKSLVIKAEGKELSTDVEEGSGNLLVINKTGPKLPMTGSAVLPFFIGVGLILMITAYRAGKKHEK